MGWKAPKGWKKLREAAFERDGLKCTKCGVEKHKFDLTIDHIIPKSQRPDLEGDLSNLTVLCRPCHAEKTRNDSNLLVKYKRRRPDNRHLAQKEDKGIVCILPVWENGV